VHKVGKLAAIYAYIRHGCGSLVIQVTLSIELNDSQVDEFQRMIPMQLALPPWNYTEALDKGITVHASTSQSRSLRLRLIRSAAGGIIVPSCAAFLQRAALQALY